jgi:hypothetical protein
VEFGGLKLCGNEWCGGSMSVVLAKDFAWETTGGAINGCGVPSPVVRLTYIRSWFCESLHRRIASAGSVNFFNAALNLLVSVPRER